MSKLPLIKFLVAFIAGILLSAYFKIDFHLIVAAAVLLLSIAVVFSVIKSDVLKTYANILILIVIVLSGYAYHTINNLDNTTYLFEEKYISDALIDGRVTDIQLPVKDKLTLEIETTTIFKNNIEFDKQINILCNLFYDNDVIEEIAAELEIGNRIVLLGDISIPPNDRNPGDFDYRSYLFQNGISAIAVSYSPLDFVKVDQKKEVFENYIYKTRHAIHNQINKVYSPKTSGLLKGLLLADRSEIGYDVKEGFIQSGVIHVLAVSGLHVGYIIIILLLLTGRLNIYLRFTIIALGLLFFVLITNHPPSVTRASIMVVLILISYLRSNKQNNFNTLAFAALILLLIDPHELFNPGFQLSFSAVLSIFLFFPIINNYINTKLNLGKFPRYILLFIGVSFAAQIGTIPFTIYYFEKLSLISLVANLVVIPLIGIILALGIWSIFLSYISTSFTYLFVLLNEGLVDVLFNIVVRLGNWEYSHLYLPNYSIWDASVYFFLLGVLIIFYRKFTHPIAKMIFVMLLISNLYLLPKLDNKKLLKKDRVNIIFIDVGDGEAAVINIPGEKNILINAGGGNNDYNSGEQIVIPLLNRFEIDKLDYCFITHFDRNKYLGVIPLIENNIVDKLIMPKVYGLDKEYELFINYLNSRNVELLYDEKKLYDFNSAKLYLLSDEIDSEYSYFNIMNKSMPVKLIYGNNSFLFTGGLEIRGERIILNSFNGFIDSDVIQLANNGSNISSSNEFIKMINPKIAVINNRLGNYLDYPSGEVIEKLSASNTNILRTDYEGAVILESNGDEINLINWREDW